MEREREYPPRLRISGDIPEKQRKPWLRDFLAEDFGIEGEREKTEEDEHLIDYLNAKGNELASRYDFEWAPVPVERIHFFSPEAFKVLCKKYRQREGTEGITFQNVQHAIEDKPSSLWRANTTMHEMVHGEEMIHLNLIQESYRSLFFIPRRRVKSSRIRRLGLQVPGGRVYLTDLNESITSIFTDEAMEGVANDARLPAHLREEAQRFAKIQKWLNREMNMNAQIRAVYNAHILEGLEALYDKNAGRKEIAAFVEQYADEIPRLFDCSSYIDERADYSALIDHLQKQNSEDFPTSQQVHALFVLAAMKGELVPLARLFQKTFGKDALLELGKGPEIEDPVSGEKKRAGGGLRNFVARHGLP